MNDQVQINERKKLAEEERVAFLNRLNAEADDLKNKVDGLHNFIQSSAYYGVSDVQKGLMQSQLGYMMAYHKALRDRLKDLTA